MKSIYHALTLRTFQPRLALPLRDWFQVMRERHALGSLTPENLRDIGISEGRRAQEANRPFWDLPSNR